MEKAKSNKCTVKKGVAYSLLSDCGPQQRPTQNDEFRCSARVQAQTEANKVRNS